MLSYLQSHIAHNKVFSKERTYELITKAQSGCAKSKDLLVMNNLGFVACIANKRCFNYHLNFEDLFQEGIFGLIKAIEKFDISRDVEFSTYAGWWVDQSIRRYIQESFNSVRIPVWIHDLRSRYKNLKKLDDTKTDDFYIRLVAKQSKSSIKSVYNAIKSYNISYESIDSNESFLQIAAEFDDDYVDLDMINANKLLKFVTEREREIIIMRVRGETLQMIAFELGLSRERIRQIFDSALRKIRALIKLSKFGINIYENI